MKTSNLPLYIFTATLFALPALAQTEATAEKIQPERSGEMKPRMQEMIKLYDKDGDGKLSEEEKAAARTAMRKEGGGRPGKGGPGDGRMREEVIKRFDKDGDGKLNEAEWAEAKKFREERMKNGGPGGPGGPMREEALKKFDKDGDGKLSEEERAEARKAWGERQKNGDK